MVILYLYVVVLNLFVVFFLSLCSCSECLYNCFEIICNFFHLTVICLALAQAPGVMVPVSDRTIQ